MSVVRFGGLKVCETQHLSSEDRLPAVDRRPRIRHRDQVLTVWRRFVSRDETLQAIIQSLPQRGPGGQLTRPCAAEPCPGTDDKIALAGSLEDEVHAGLDGLIDICGFEVIVCHGRLLAVHPSLRPG